MILLEVEGNEDAEIHIKASINANELLTGSPMSTAGVSRALRPCDMLKISLFVLLP